MDDQNWPEIDTVVQERRYELVLHGSNINARIEKHGGLHANICKLTNLNFLRISHTCLSQLPEDIGNLINLKNLILDHNKLTSIPSSIGQFTKLKLLDLSYNNLEKLPHEIGQLEQLTDLNLVCNQLMDLPASMGQLAALTRINVSNNKLSQLPNQFYHASNLCEFRAANNTIHGVTDAIASLNQLKTLDFTGNKIELVPHQIALCSKLKELTLMDNPIKDRKCIKLTKQNNSKLLIEYLRNCNKKATADSQISKKGAGKSPDQADHDTSANSEDQLIALEVRILPTPDIKIYSAGNVLDVRPYIVCCILKGVDFSREDVFKKFIALQTKLHDTICDKRMLATIATHDYSKVEFPLSYQAEAPEKISIIPLDKECAVTAKQFIDQLVKDSNVTGQAKRKNKNSGLQKYLTLVKESKILACLIDCKSNVISLPPLVNSEKTKISPASKEILLEVTSSKSLAACKKVMNTLIENIAELVINSDKVLESEPKSILLEQVRVGNQEGSLKVVYPSRTDLTNFRKEISIQRA
ncbi:Leucine-rich repeat-containing protein 47 [Trichoplax sp. H2]|nr:Leucine-rich repeat-containing protein 47 [Trichoplax sp. H2]|eukprot:RDD41031.1 Leucine-rich repeat-containing protein 47 [Trichoplax sp. H2]